MRPVEYTPEIIAKLVKEFEQYIYETDMPIIAEFAWQNDIERQLLYDKDEFSTLRKKAIDKKEAYLERTGLDGTSKPAMAIFSLKQLGWRDRQEIEHDVKGGLTIRFGGIDEGQ